MTDMQRADETCRINTCNFVMSDATSIEFEKRNTGYLVPNPSLPPLVAGEPQWATKGTTSAVGDAVPLQIRKKACHSDIWQTAGAVACHCDCSLWLISNWWRHVGVWRGGTATPQIQCMFCVPSSSTHVILRSFAGLRTSPTFKVSKPLDTFACDKVEQIVGIGSTLNGRGPSFTKFHRKRLQILPRYFYCHLFNFMSRERRMKQAFDVWRREFKVTFYKTKGEVNLTNDASLITEKRLG